MKNGVKLLGQLIERELFTINSFKKLFISLRTFFKFFTLIIIATLAIACIFLFLYRPIYSVTIDGEFVGYSESKTKLQNKINTYMEKGTGENNIAFVQIEDIPEYTMCILKRGKITNDDEIYERIINSGVVYYEYYAVTLDDEAKAFVPTYSDAKSVISELEDKKSSNIDDISMVKIYNEEIQEFTDVDDIVNDLYKKPVTVTTYKSSGSVSAAGVNLTSSKASIGITLIEPLTNYTSISSKFGYRSSGLHTGLDLSAPSGTTIRAAASGTVITSTALRNSSGYYYSYGEYIEIRHSDGTITRYAHGLSGSRQVSVGDYVEQGQYIMKVGSTGNSTGSHLHFEVIVNGVRQNPQNYVY